MEQQLEAASLAFQKLQKDLTKAVETRQRLDSQLQENELVEKEFQSLGEDANIYKLIGPVLVKQEREEAKTNVENRLRLIREEIARVEKQLTDLTEKSKQKQGEVSVYLRSTDTEKTEMYALH
ncbi:hypothetical protein BZG36_02628 [Bifiguratus adelaidae]|uniref:Prefoldin subunit 6 n=1 Tax=Bifiguratus adelaidae TaxID=1938954 RepID=A0A261Y2M3_9FUNG|nr:hypothetical protein BZG36_02628 [Bifiguratus adelaidae]